MGIKKVSICRFLFNHRLSHFLVFTPLVVLAAAPAAWGATASWNQTAGGTFNWNDNLNWTAAFPNGTGDTATINTNLVGNEQIDLNVGINVNSLTVGDSTTPFFNFTIAPGTAGALTVTGNVTGTRGVNQITAPVTLTNAAHSFTVTAAANALASLSFTDNLTLSAPSVARVLTLTGANSSGTGTSQGTITGNITAASGAGSWGITKAGTGTWILSGTNSYTGPTSITAGTLVANDGVGISSSSAVAISGAFTTWSSSADITRSLGTGPGQISMTSGTGITGFNSRNAAGITVAIGGLANPTPLTWGSTNFNPGILYFNHVTDDANPSVSALGNITFTNALDLNGAARAVQSNGSNGNNTYVTTYVAELTGNITGATGSSLRKDSIGTVKLSGALSFDGAISVTEGALVLSNTSNSYTGSTTITVTGAPARIATLQLGASGVIPDTSAVTLVQNGNTATNSTLDMNGFSETIGSLTAAAAGVVRRTTIDNTSATPVTLTIDQTTNTTFDGRLNNSVGGALSIVKQGAGQLTLQATNSSTSAANGGNSTMTGTLTVSNGILRTVISDAIPDGATLVASGTGAFRMNTDLTAEGVAGVRLDGGDMNASSNATATLTSASAYDVRSGTISASGAGTNNGLVLAGSVGLTKTTAGTATFGTATTGAASTNHTYTGVTTLAGGVLAVYTLANGGSASGIGASGSGAGNLVFDGGTLQYLGATTSTDRNFTINNATTGTIDVSDAVANLTISGAAAATTGALTKAGAGTLTLSGNNLYTGITTINAGVLALSGGGTISADLDLNGGDLSLSSSLSLASLIGAGDIIGGQLVTVSNSFSPGHSLGLINHTGDFTLGGSSTTTMEIDLSLNQFDELNVSNILTYGGTLNVLFSGSNPAGGIYDVFDFTSSSGSIAFNYSGLSGSQTASFDPVNGAVTVTPVPEPGSLVMMLFGVVAAMTMFRRK